jgi:predicted RNA binding protein YcfA (HicA-like mRNA interferase family)
MAKDKKVQPCRDKREVIERLKAAGFYFVRNGKHEIWSNGQRNIPIPHGNKIEQRLLKMISLQIERPFFYNQEQAG